MQIEISLMPDAAGGASYLTTAEAENTQDSAAISSTAVEDNCIEADRHADVLNYLPSGINASINRIIDVLRSLNFNDIEKLLLVLIAISLQRTHHRISAVKLFFNNLISATTLAGMLGAEIQLDLVDRQRRVFE